MARAAAIKFALTSFLLAIACSSPSVVQARGPLPDTPAQNRVSTIAVAELPRQGKEIYEQVRKGGPFAYDKDGSVFGNRERMLPAHPRGYYREYTVRTPGSRDRGARRIVCGGQPRAPDACYYTSDHYASFRRIVD